MKIPIAGPRKTFVALPIGPTALSLSLSLFVLSGESLRLGRSRPTKENRGNATIALPVVPLKPPGKRRVRLIRVRARRKIRALNRRAGRGNGA